MNIVEQLLTVDESKIEEKEVRTFKSERLKRIFGVEEAIDIEVQEVPYRRVTNIMSKTFKGNGNMNYERKVDSELLLVLEAVQNIDFKNHDLMAKFHCQTPKDLAEKILGNDVPKIATMVMDMVGWTGEDDEDEIKN